MIRVALPSSKRPREVSSSDDEEFLGFPNEPKPIFLEIGNPEPEAVRRRNKIPCLRREIITRSVSRSKATTREEPPSTV